MLLSYNLSNIFDSKDGFIISKTNGIDRFGLNLGGGGDINGDGINDFVISSYGSTTNGRLHAGDTYVIFGRTDNNFPTDLSLLNGENGFIIHGIDDNDSNAAFSPAAPLLNRFINVVVRFVNNAIITKDINGDGFDDIILGFPGADVGEKIKAGQTVIFNGHKGPFKNIYDLKDLLDGTANYQGTIINGINGLKENMANKDIGLISPTNPTDVQDLFGDVSGWSIADIGDINGDGINDLGIGAPGALRQNSKLVDDAPTYLYNYLPAGQAYIIYGSKTGLPSTINLADLNDKEGFIIDGIKNSEGTFGWPIAPAGDFNGDGIDDFIIGAHTAPANGNYWAGQTYVLYGTKEGFKGHFNIDELDGKNGFIINGINKGDWSSECLGGIGDINGDGFDDILITARHATTNGNEASGQAYIVYGTNKQQDKFLNLTDLDGKNGVTINGEESYDALGFTSLNGVGDINNDGFDDIVISAPGADPHGKSLSGKFYIIYGQENLPSTINLTNPPKEIDGFVLNGPCSTDVLGITLNYSNPKDINNDGIDDLIIGSFGFLHSKAYVIYGQDGGILQNYFNNDNLDTLSCPWSSELLGLGWKYYTYIGETFFS
jgi:hypothetical protein